MPPPILLTWVLLGRRPALHQDRERRQVARLEEGLVGVQGAPGCQSEAFERRSRELHRRLRVCRHQVYVDDRALVDVVIAARVAGHGEVVGRVAGVFARVGQPGAMPPAR